MIDCEHIWHLVEYKVSDELVMRLPECRICRYKFYEWEYRVSEAKKDD